MNYYQRDYEKSNRRNLNLKLIKRTNNSKLKNNSIDLYKNYFAMRENEIYKKIISNIRTTKTRPKMNDYHKTKEEKLRDYRQQNRTLENRKLVRENSNYKKRLKSQKSMLRIREIDKDYKQNHQKMLERLKKKNTIFLPSLYINRYVKRDGSSKSKKK
jgi:hypothetical protein